MIEGDLGNYNIYIIDLIKNLLVFGELGKFVSGFMVYYKIDDFVYVCMFNGLEVEMDVVIYIYRLNNLLFVVYYVGGLVGIIVNLNDV